MPEILEYTLRTVLAFFFILLVTVPFGQKQLAQITLFDFVCTTTLGILAVSTLVTHTLGIFTGLIAPAVWGGLFLFSKSVSVSRRSLPARKPLAGEPIMVIYNGQILETTLAKTYYNTQSLLEQLRINNVFDPAEIQVGILEMDGELSILKKADIQTKNPSVEKFTGKELIINGQLVDTALRRAGLTREWLQFELTSRGIADASEVVFAALTPAGKLYIDIKEDRPKKN